MVDKEGLEPSTYGLEVRCSIHLSYLSKLVDPHGLEP